MLNLKMSLNQRALFILNYCANPSGHSNKQTFEYTTLPLTTPSSSKSILSLFKSHNWLILMPSMTVFFAIVFTQSVLLLANNQPLNILLMLIVLVLMPWLSYFLILMLKVKLTLYFPTATATSNQSKVLLVFIKRLSSQLAFLFALTSWFCIWLNLLIKDIPLGWSSTFNLSAAQLNDMSHLISFAWNTWLESATLDEAWFKQNKFYHLQSINHITPAHSMQGWKFLMAAVLFFSILPRLIIFIVHSLKLSQQLKSWIKWQWPLLQYTPEQVAETSKNQSVKKENVELNNKDINTQDYDVLLSWQMSAEVIKRFKNINVTLLGSGTWQDDQQKIQLLKDDNISKNILVLVDATQAPIADIADLINELLDKNKLDTNKVVKRKIESIVLFINTRSTHPLRDGQIYSWQVFAKELGVQSYLTDQL